MLQFFRNANYNFTGSMKLCFSLSATLVIASLVLMLIHGGPRLSIDFTGGSVVQVKFAESPGISQVRSGLETRGYPGVQVTEFGAADEFLITVPATKSHPAHVTAGPGQRAAAHAAAMSASAWYIW